jgi:putative FmdB family regulatory protein
MPMFEYRCQGCGKQFETLVRGGDRVQCPSCQGESLEKLLSVFAVNASGASEPAPRMAGGPCGSCGDPRGPGACALN